MVGHLAHGRPYDHGDRRCPRPASAVPHRGPAGRAAPRAVAAPRQPRPRAGFGPAGGSHRVFRPPRRRAGDVGGDVVGPSLVGVRSSRPAARVARGHTEGTRRPGARFRGFRGRAAPLPSRPAPAPGVAPERLARREAPRVLRGLGRPVPLVARRVEQGSAVKLRLVDRVPDLDVDELVARLVPPRRFAGVRFETYVPSPEHPSQAAALVAMERFAADLIERERPTGRRFAWRRRDVEQDGPPARYLDGGYGVGKTHLLAALWHAAPGPKAYLTFAELTALIGFVGMDTAVGALGTQRLLCIDEFELDDVANTLMTVTLLRSIIPAVRVVTTSNA